MTRSKSYEKKFLEIEINYIIFFENYLLAGQPNSLLQISSFVKLLLSFLLFSKNYIYIMLYTKFIFGDFKGKSTKDRQLHPYGAFVEPLGPTPNSELAWMSKLRIDQARLVSKIEDASLNMVALLPRSSCPMLSRPSFLIKHD